jgi:8-oxo-dGTP diphosphatase
MTHYEVCAAVITRRTADGKKEIFCAQRPGPKPGKTVNETNYKWEFPGGKIEAGETREAALIREILEEFDTLIAIDSYITTVTHNYASFSITMHAFYCTITTGTLTLKEHLAAKWLSATQLAELDWAAADIPVMQIAATGSN